jgi:arginine decarboxylase
MNKHDPRVTYNVAHWSGGYFDVNDGRLLARPSRTDGAPTADIYEIARQAQAEGLSEQDMRDIAAYFAQQP